MVKYSVMIGGMRLEGLAMFLILVGLALIVGYGAYQIIRNLFLLTGMPIIIKVGLIMVLLGILVVIIKLIFERLKGGNEEDVDRKYEAISGKKIVKTLGMVRGNTIRARHIGNDILAGLRNIVGGEVKEYTRMITESREEALNRMVADAKRLGANAVVGVRFTTSQVMQGAAEILAYGTAVVIEEE